MSLSDLQSALPMEAVTIHFAPKTGSEEEWNEAYARLADYFRSFRLHNRIRRTQLILETLRRAADAHEADPKRTPTAHAIEQARLMLREWLGQIYEGMELTESQIEGSGRLGFHLCDGPTRWPHFFIDRDNLPPDMAEAMRSAIRASGPRLQVSKMTPRPIDLGLFGDEEEDETDRRPFAFVRYFVLLLFVAAVLTAVYRLTIDK
ncbi:hypothetical protein [Verrucomicrobium sp. BvORR034]|uniref:hypothetical protein n=1 Tax=Verrucomicrobium sp. BvORR034 TaxID=1396418 RepID=UPI00224102CE|nr:hypothetical protein [Verrucomicrobium sp. BvORR034]